MNVLILAAGYATRLHPLTLNQAKPLLDVAGKPMMEWVINHLKPVAEEIQTVYIVTNDRFANHFQQWVKSYQAKFTDAQQECPFRFEVINDGSTSDEDKLGALGDIHLVMQKAQLQEEDLLVVAGDNLFSDSLEEFVRFSKKHEAVLATYDVKDLEAIKKYNNLTLDAEGRIKNFEEKPQQPTGTVTGIALYYYSKSIVPLIDIYIMDGNNPDQPGRFVQWLYKMVPVYTFPIQGTWFDIGSEETLRQANEAFLALA